MEEKLNLKFPVIVEGKYDKSKLSLVVASPIITLDGFAIFKNEEKKALLKRLSNEKGIILLADSDRAGNFIRSKLKGIIKGTVYNVYTPTISGKERRKAQASADGLLGVVGIDSSVLRELLLPFADDKLRNRSQISKLRFYEDGFSGTPDSSDRREQLAELLSFPKTLTAKALLDAINLLCTEEEYLSAVAKVKNKKNITVSIQTLGCRVNLYESCAIAERLRENGCIVTKKDKCDYYIVNSCAVTSESERKSRQLVRRLAAKGKVLVIGCAAQLENGFKDIENVIYVGGNNDKGAVVDVILGNVKSDVDVVKPMDCAPYEELYINGEDDLFSECRAFVKIQDGCNGKCTYCIIPKCRGPVRSRSAENVISEVKRLVANGYSEIILTGIEVGAYNKIPLYELIEKVSAVEGVKRLRLGSLSPNIITEKFLDSVSKLDNFMPHMHLSLQSCSDSVLSGMKRAYRKKEICEKIDLIRRYIPNCMLSADIIVGFPGESEYDFIETVETIKNLKIFHVHSFPYSERPGTIAADMPLKVPKDERSDRNTRLISVCFDIKKEILDSKIGQFASCLVEKIVDGVAYGHTEQYLNAGFDAENVKVGDIVDVKIDSHCDDVMYCSKI